MSIDTASREQLQSALQRYVIPRKCAREYPVVMRLLRDKVSADNYIGRLKVELHIAEQYMQELQDRLHKLESTPKLESKPAEVASGLVAAN